MKTLSNTFTTLTLLILTIGSANAETRYVSDELIITLRSGESSRHQILRTAKSGTQMELLDSHPETGYSRVRLTDGTEGWVLSQYLTTTPPAKQRLDGAHQELANSKQQINALRSQLKQTQYELSEREQRIQILLRQNESLENDIIHIRNIAGHAPALNTQNQALKADVIRLETMVQTLEQENLLIKDRSARDWFIAGTGVTIMGMAIGFVAYKMRSQKRSSWSEL